MKHASPCTSTHTFSSQQPLTTMLTFKRHLLILGLAALAMSACSGNPSTGGNPNGSGEENGGNGEQTTSPESYGTRCTGPQDTSCGDDAQCEPYDNGGTEFVCTIPCDSTQDCPTDIPSRCIDTGLSDTHICLPRSMSPMYGETCDLNDPDACGQGTTCEAYSQSSNDAFCTITCTSDSDCDQRTPSSCLALDSTQGLRNLCVPNDLCIDPDNDQYGSGPGCIAFDCDQSNPLVNPGADEYCDGIDNDCNGEIDDNVVDANGPCDTGLLGLCADGILQCQDAAVQCVPRVLPGERQELCDGIDNDCDGLIDEGPSWIGLMPDGKIPEGFDSDNPTPPEPGTEVDTNDNYVVGIGRPCGNPSSNCFSGYQYCDVTTYSLQCSQPQDHLGDIIDDCNGQDDNCNGVIDEDANDPDNLLGRPCFAGEGTCMGSGTYVCDADPSAPPVCNATSRPDNAEKETCDYTDEDCDNVVDNDFVDQNGVYARLDNCGRCHNDCRLDWGGDACTTTEEMSFGETDEDGHDILRATAARCDATGMDVACVVTGQQAQCTTTCIPGTYDLDRVPSNGCEFQPDLDAIYVAKENPNDNPLLNPGQNTATCGTFDQPCLTIGHAIKRATCEIGDASCTKKTNVFVSEGIYEEAVTMANGISVLGGFSPTTWERSIESYVATIKGGITLDNIHKAAIVIQDITEQTEFSGFTIDADDAEPQGNAYGIYVKNSGAQLTIQKNIIHAGQGGAGTTGTHGEKGESGQNGGAGNKRVIDQSSCSDATSPPLLAGGAGGATTCDGVNVGGGAGAAITICPSTSFVVINGNTYGEASDGHGPNHGAGGRSTRHVIASSFYNNIYECNGDEDAEHKSYVGGNGTDGTSGQGGSAVNDNVGQSQDAHWRGNAGHAGQQGTAGSGGGGGGSIGGTYDNKDGYSLYHYGPTGGGGGAGGCGGKPGDGGTAGGGSFGIFLAFSQNTSSIPTVEANTITRNNGGTGGDGGIGGAGGAGGDGGAGGEMNYDGGRYSMCNAAPGKRGGTGGGGGPGGGGSGGNGGVSFDIAIAGNTHNATHVYNDTDKNTSTAGNADTGGAGGEGGKAVAQAGSAGRAGVSGFFHQFP